jgi:AraC-like DNA-binding protein
MLLLDALFRFSGLGLLALIAAINIRDNRQWRSRPFLTLSCLSVGALFLGYTIEPFTATASLHYIVRILDVPHLVFVWLFALSLYCKDFRLTLFHWGAGAVYCAPILYVRMYGFGFDLPIPEWLVPFISVTSLILVGHLVYATLRERQDDLLYDRRKSRLYFVLVIVFVSVVAAISEPFLVGGNGVKAETFKILSIWPAIAVGALWLLRASQNAVNPIDLANRAHTISGRDSALIRKLHTAMVEDEKYRSFDLTIQTLAGQLGVTQHRLRSVINHALGHQNFSSYVNEYRIAAVKEVLSDPQQRHVPIQTIAMDCGFKSISPFNRAFRMSEGVTPSAYRDAQLN